MLKSIESQLKDVRGHKLAQCGANTGEYAQLQLQWQKTLLCPTVYIAIA